MKKHKSFPFFLFLLPIFIILYLYSRNITEVEFIDILRPLVMLLFVFLGLFFLVNTFIHDSMRASIIVFSVLTLFFLYGHVHDFLKVHPILSINLGHHSIIGIVWLGLMLLIPILVISQKKLLNPVMGTYLNLVMVILTFFSIYKVASTILVRKVSANSSTIYAAEAQNLWLSRVKQPLVVTKNGNMPDIYYIIPDMFARSDVIADFTGFDNSNFVDSLRDLGFYVAECSRSNYASTQLSITSSLNAHYLDQIQSGMTDRGMLREPMSNSLVRSSLEDIGYKTIVFDNEFGLTEIETPDLLISQQQNNFLFRPYSPFENMIVYGSILRVGYDVDLGVFSDLYDKLFFPYREYVGAQENILRNLPLTVNVAGPKFVFAHIMAPHPPYLFREDGTIETDSDFYREALGQPVTQELYIEGYKRQVIFVEDQIINIVKEIISNSENDPIIIIQGDHGIDGSNRMDILNAYYVPKVVESLIFSTITPVNTFRVIFNGVFETHYELLPDESWYSVYPDWFDIELVVENNPACLVDK